MSSLCFCCHSCMHSNSSGLKPNSILTIKLDLQDVAETADEFNKMISDIEFVPLETSDSLIVGPIQKINYQNDCIYILDKYSNFFSFKQNGKFNFKITPKGKGKGEQREIRDFSILPDGNICLLDYLKYFKYDTSGILIEIIDIMVDGKINPTAFLITNEYQYLYEQFNPGYEHEFALLVSQHGSKRILNHYFPYKNASVSINRFVQSGAAYLIPPVTGNDTIYKITDGEIKPFCFVDFGANKVLAKCLIKDKKYDEIVECFQINSCAYNIDHPVINGEFLIFDFVLEDHRLYQCSYSFKANESKIINSKNVSVFEPDFYYCSYDDKLITYKESWFIISQLREKKTTCSFLNEKRRFELLEKLKKVKETDNPVLMIIKTKKHAEI